MIFLMLTSLVSRVVTQLKSILIVEESFWTPKAIGQSYVLTLLDPSAAFDTVNQVLLYLYSLK